MRLVFFGSGAFAEPTLEWLPTAGHEVSLVVTQPARESGRGRRVVPTPVRVLADKLGLPCLETEDVNAPEVAARLWSQEARVGLVIAFGQKLGSGALRAFPCGCVNLHASLLPRYRGAAPIQRAIAGGESQTGVTVFRIVERMDAGPILIQTPTPIGTDENAGELHDRLAQLGVDAVRETLALLETGNPPGRSQIESAATAARKLVKADGWVHFDRTAEQIVRHVRAMTPWPGAGARFESHDGRWENLTLLRVRADDQSRGHPPADTSSQGLAPECTMLPPPGTINSRLCVAVKDGFLEILELKPSSGRSMSWSDYVNGRRVAPGDRFMTPT